MNSKSSDTSDTSDPSDPDLAISTSQKNVPIQNAINWSSPRLVHMIEGNYLILRLRLGLIILAYSYLVRYLVPPS